MVVARLLLVVGITLALAPRLTAAGPPSGPLPSQIARWIEELGDDSFAVREEATKKLRAAGERAELALIQALNSKDPEIIKRSKGLLAEFRWGIFPDTPPAVVELIRKYQSTARGDRRDVIRQLLAAGPAGNRALMRIARGEEDAQVRKEIFADIASGLPAGLPELLEANNHANIESLLELALASDSRAGVLHYTAYHLLTNQLPARIADWERRAKAAVVPKAENEVLAYFYRARGEWAKANAAAKVAEREDLQEAFLYEQGDWKELANKPRFPPTDDTLRYIAYRGAYGRLAGNKKLYEDAMADLIRTGKNVVGSGNVIRPYAKALLLNGRANEGIELLGKGDDNAVMLFEIFVAQSRVKEALALVESARKASPRAKQLSTLEIHEARLLHNLGEKDKGLATLKRYGDQIQTDADRSWHLDLIEAELHLDRRTEAFAHVSKLLSGSADRWPPKLFEKLFEKRGEDSKLLWRLVHKHTVPDTHDKKVALWRGLLEGTAEEKDAKAFLTAMRFTSREKTKDELRTLAEVAVACKQEKLAVDYFREAASCRASIRLGDLLAEKKQWREAAEQYYAAYKLGWKEDAGARGEDDGESLPALALWLSGHALTQAGQSAQGNIRMEQAHLLPLGDGEMRYDLSRAYDQRGHRAAARREQELLRLVGEPALAEPNNYFTGEGLRIAGVVAANRKEFLKAADHYEQTFLRCLHPRINFARAPAYVTVPGHVYVIRARGLLAAGRIDEALMECERARASQPGSIDLAMHAVPELERLGRKKEADEIYRQVRGQHEAVIRDYPGCAWANNQLAWLAGCCRRDLEQGLKHARKAVELSPKTAGYYDTLAEVLFQMGKKDEAIAAEKQALKISPKREYYQKQLKRLEAGDPKAPRPEEEE